MDTIETINYRGHKIQIVSDEDPCNPRTEWDNFGKMICFHRRYSLGDKHNLIPGDFEHWDDLEKYIKEDLGGVIILPLFLFDHSGISISTGIQCRWDSGKVGFIYCTQNDIKEDWGDREDGPERARKLLEGEVKTYNEYLTGEVYGYRIFYDDCEIESCYGFYGDDCKKEMVSDAKSLVDFAVKRINKKRFEKIKTMIRHKVPLLKRAILIDSQKAI